MPFEKEIVCLANSRKMSGRCIAGKVIEGGAAREWIRPVSARPSEEIAEEEREYQDGSDPRVLDIVRIRFLQAKAKPYQKENVLIDPNAQWRKVGAITLGDIDAFLDAPKILWLNRDESKGGLNDRVAIADASNLGDSLYLISVDGLELCVSTYADKTSVQARFRYRDTPYWLKVTDPIVSKQYKAKGVGSYRVGPSVMTISLGEPFEGFCYKLVAALLVK